MPKIGETYTYLKKLDVYYEDPTEYLPLEVTYLGELNGSYLLKHGDQYILASMYEIYGSIEEAVNQSKEDLSDTRALLIQLRDETISRLQMLDVLEEDYTRRIQ